MLERYIEKGGKRLRCGYTTGSCAAAAAKAAVMMLLTGQPVSQVTIDTPKGWTVEIPIEAPVFRAGKASCYVVKDGGDDPDATDGAHIVATVVPNTEGVIRFRGGPGVGTVTQKGLSIPPGEPAINPVPRTMITREIEKVAPGQGFDVEISIPGGETIAARTFNPRLGIVGGLSILGTSGIVEPMSEEALKASMKLELSMLVARGTDMVLFVPGNYGKDYARSCHLNLEYLVKTSNYVGFMLEEAEQMGIKKILFISHLGKIVKVAGGIFNTHSHTADARMEILAANLALLGGTQATVQKIMNSTTTDEATEYIQEAQIDGYFDHLAEAAKRRCEEKVYHHIQIEVIIFSKAHGFLGESQGAQTMVKELCIN